MLHLVLEALKENRKNAWKMKIPTDFFLFLPYRWKCIIMVSIGLLLSVLILILLHFHLMFKNVTLLHGQGLWCWIQIFQTITKFIMNTTLFCCIANTQNYLYALECASVLLKHTRWCLNTNVMKNILLCRKKNRICQHNWPHKNVYIMIFLYEYHYKMI